MYSHKLFRWIILSCALVLFTFVMLENGVLVEILSKDTTNISIAIIASSIIAHFFVLKNIVSYDDHLNTKLWYIAEALVAMGMIGTVVGFTMLFGEAFANLDVSDTTSVGAVIVDLGLGMGTALVTTLMGLICSLILKGELVFLNGDIDESVQ